MEQWVPFNDGEYLVKDAWLVAPDDNAIAVKDTVIEVYTDIKGIRQIRGTGMIRPMLMVELHEEHENLDMILNFGGEFKYRLENPTLNAGKVFTPDVSAVVIIYPTTPWVQISEDEYGPVVEQLTLID